jgi:hypothetical protein
MKRTTLYKIDRSHGPVSLFSEVAAGAVFASKHSAKPEDPDLPEVECYCENTTCVVREVNVAMKLRGTKQPPKYRCPVCGWPMKRHGYRSDVTLVPVRRPVRRPEVT